MNLLASLIVGHLNSCGYETVARRVSRTDMIYIHRVTIDHTGEKRHFLAALEVSDRVFAISIHFKMANFYRCDPELFAKIDQFLAFIS